MAEGKTIVNDEILTEIKSRIEGIKFGYVTITVQDNKVIQIETNEKTRLKSI
jgi:hypothetical protein